MTVNTFIQSRRYVFLSLLMMSMNATLSAGTFVVTSTADPSNPFVIQPGTLRWAITQAELTPNTASTITFNISGTGQHIIQYSHTMPTVYGTVRFDGSTQPGYSTGNPMIILDGGGTVVNAFEFSGNNSLAKGFYIRNFFVAGIGAMNANRLQIIDNIINGINGQAFNQDIILNNSSGCIITGNYLGVDASLTPSVKTSWFGLFIEDASNNNIIGGATANLQNVIANHSYDGVNFTAISGTPNGNLYGFSDLITRNRIYNNASHAIYLRGTAGGNQGKAKPIISPILTLANVTGTSGANDIVELFGSTGPENANQYLTTVTANNSGQWADNLSGSVWGFVTATATDNANNTSQLSIAQKVSIAPVCPTCAILSFTVPPSLCSGTGITFANTSSSCSQPSPTFQWNFGDGTGNLNTNIHSYASAGTYTVTLTIPGTRGCPIQTTSQVVAISTCLPPCKDCLPSFAPQPDSTYIISSWVKQAALPSVLTYPNPQIFLDFTGHPSQGPFTATGDIIDGWQRIENTFTVPHGATSFAIRLNSASGDVFFDDIRVFPFKGSMKSYVYDPITLRLSAELDERNYATIYEYDEEGKLIRLKKETERGVMTIKENKNNTVKRTK
jgi:hypothetical protein